jgi:hypothetical protein
MFYGLPRVKQFISFVSSFSFSCANLFSTPQKPGQLILRSIPPLFFIHYSGCVFFVSGSYLSVTTFHKSSIRPFFGTTGGAVTLTLRPLPNWETKVWADRSSFASFKYKQNTGYTRYRELVSFICKKNSSSIIPLRESHL